MILIRRKCVVVARTLIFVAVACMGNTIAVAASGDQAIPEDRIVYSPEFFQRYAPQTAADMVLQVPGFLLVGADRNNNNNNDERGLGQGDGNLLINGKRPSTKDDSPLALLGRIPAENVERLEILNQGSRELAGQSGQIVNVVYVESGTLNGSWEVQAHTLERGKTEPKLKTSVAGKWNDINYTAEINFDGNEFPQWGPERAYDENDQLWEIREEASTFYHHQQSANVGLNWEGANGQVANLSLLYSNDNSTFSEDSDRYQPSSQGGRGDLVSEVRFTSRTANYNYEIGGDYSTGMNVFADNGELKIIGLKRYSNAEENNLFKNLPTSGSHYLFKSQAKPIASEYILRTLYTWTTTQGSNFEFAIEGAKNTLETSSVFSEDTGSGYQSLLLPGSDIDIDEKRAETSLQFSTSLGENWTTQMLAAVEYSKISVNGDIASHSESFVRYKGFVGLTGALSKQLRLRTRIERSVGQLNFGDFASSINVNEETTDGGNTKLEPSQTWRASVTLEYSFAAGDMLTVTGFAEQVDDFITFVPLENHAEGKGNIDKLTRQGIDITATVSLDRFGIEGGKLDLLGEFHENEMRDPVTGEKRSYRQNQYTPGHYRVSFRQDVVDTPYAWGLVIEEQSENIRYRIDQVNKFNHHWPLAHRLFIEHKNLAGMSLRLEVEDFFGFTYEGRRYFYEGDRNGPLIGRESNSRHSPWIVRLQLSGVF